MPEQPPSRKTLYEALYKCWTTRHYVARFPGLPRSKSTPGLLESSGKTSLEAMIMANLVDSHGQKLSPSSSSSSVQPPTPPSTPPPPPPPTAPVVVCSSSASASRDQVPLRPSSSSSPSHSVPSLLQQRRSPGGNSRRTPAISDVSSPTSSPPHPQLPPPPPSSSSPLKPTMPYSSSSFVAVAASGPSMVLASVSSSSSPQPQQRAAYRPSPVSCRVAGRVFAVDTAFDRPGSVEPTAMATTPTPVYSYTAAAAAAGAAKDGRSREVDDRLSPSYRPSTSPFPSLHHPSSFDWDRSPPFRLVVDRTTPLPYVAAAAATPGFSQSRPLASLSSLSAPPSATAAVTGGDRLLSGGAREEVERDFRSPGSEFHSLSFRGRPGSGHQQHLGHHHHHHHHRDHHQLSSVWNIPQSAPPPPLLPPPVAVTGTGNDAPFGYLTPRGTVPIPGTWPGSYQEIAQNLLLPLHVGVSQQQQQQHLQNESYCVHQFAGTRLLSPKPQPAPAAAAASSFVQAPDLLLREISLLRNCVQSLESENATLAIRLNEQQFQLNHRLQGIELQMANTVSSSGDSPCCSDDNFPIVNKESVI